jgi:hypothetical protein
MHIIKNVISWKTSMVLLGIGLLFATPGFPATVIVSWDANSEMDLAGYKLYYGEVSGVYTSTIDVGNVTEFEVSGLEVGETYYFVVTAYDLVGNESDPSDEVMYYVPDISPPLIVSATCEQNDRVAVVFNEALETASAESAGNYTISNGIVVQTAELQPDLKTVHLYTTLHLNGSYTLTVENVRDTAQVNNVIESGSQVTYSWSGNDEVAPEVVSVELYRRDFLVITFSKSLNQTSALTLGNMPSCLL